MHFIAISTKFFFASFHMLHFHFFCLQYVVLVILTVPVLLYRSRCVPFLRHLYLFQSSPSESAVLRAELAKVL